MTKRYITFKRVNGTARGNGPVNKEGKINIDGDNPGGKNMAIILEGQRDGKGYEFSEPVESVRMNTLCWEITGMNSLDRPKNRMYNQRRDIIRKCSIPDDIRFRIYGTLE